MEKEERFGIETKKELLFSPLVREQKALIPYLFAKEKHLLPIEEKEEAIVVAFADPFDIAAIIELKVLLQKEILPVKASTSAIELAIEKAYHQKEEETKEFFSSLEKKEEEKPFMQSDVYDLLERSDHNPVVRMVNTILLEALQQGSSDVHFEPTEKGLCVRYRVDGCLQGRHSPPKEYQQQVLTRLKVMAKMDIAEQRLPQDGRIKLRQGGREIDFRVSTLPTGYGERVVLRILDKSNVLLGLDSTGMGEKLLKSFRKLIESPEGIVLVTGPTGSGKTTTLYSALFEIQTEETNIITVEDPVEYKIPGISQMNVNPKIDLSFAKGLRHILRQDPDVIMIGEIRDKETAEIAIQASLTGHLVLSTLHTNDAPSSLTRLADMGIEPYLLASSILGVLAQRLLRKICPHCKEAYVPDESERKEIGVLQAKKFYRAKGCEECFQTGYKGRLGIYELMEMTPKIKEQVLKSQDAHELKRIALKGGMKTLFDQGVELILQGITTSDELFRVTKSESVEGYT